MPRPTKHDEFAILGAAAKIAAADGPRAVTLAAITKAMGAPNGSIYYRFASRDVLLGRLWLMKASFFQNEWARASESPDALQAGLQAALSIPRVARQDLDGSRIMLIHRREDFLSEAWPEEMKAEAVRLGQQAIDRIEAMTKRLFGRVSDEARAVTMYCTLDLPMAAVRRYVASHKEPPVVLDDLISKAYLAVIKQST